MLLDKYYHILYLDINSIISAVLEGHQSVHLVIIIHIVYLRDLFNPVFFSFMTLITRFGTRVTRSVSHMEQKLLTLPEQWRSLLVFSGVRVARSFVVGVVLCISLFIPLSSLC